MPFAKQIEIEHVSIIPSASPMIENQPAIMTKTKNADESRGDYECQEIASSSLSYQFDQWDALAEREGHAAYSIQTKFSKKEEVCRGKLCDWCYNIVDGYELDRSTAAVAMSYFDRLVPRTKGRYWILSIAACLNIAIKVNSYGGQMISPKKMAELASTIIIMSNDKSYSSGDILKMEIYVLEELNWFVNPPVPQTFLDIISPILTHSPMCQYDFDDEDNVVIDGEVRHILCQTAQFLCELSVFDVFFSTENPSAIAIAALLVALDVMQFPAGASKWVLSLPLDCNLDELNIYAQRLHKLYEHEGNGPQCTYWSNSSTGEDSDEVGKARTITPLKDEMPPSIKRCREDTIEARSIEGKAAEGNTTNASKKRKIK